MYIGNDQIVHAAMEKRHQDFYLELPESVPDCQYAGRLIGEDKMEGKDDYKNACRVRQRRNGKDR